MFSKLVVFVVVAGGLLQFVAGQEFPGTPVKSPYSIATFSYEFPTQCNATGIYTACDSCYSTMVCIQGDVQEKVCPLDKPFCNKNACSASISSEYECTPTPLKCTGVGFYPDPKACQYYHYCEAAAEESSVYDCQPNNVFNAATHLCKQKKLAADCVTVTCDPNKIFQSYGTSQTYFAFCSESTGEIKVMKCDANYLFNGSACVFQCPKEGNFADSDPNKYFECVLSGTKLVATELSCPEGKQFNADVGICLTSSA